jgi:hypothetical protein
MSSEMPGTTPLLQAIIRALGPLFSGRALFAYPILIVCILAELLIQWATLSYEQLSAPPNVPKFPLLGVSLFGMIILILEMFKLPMAAWGASISGWRRVFCNIVILILCILTWATIKDIGYNDSNAALASARAKAGEATRLQEDLEALDRRLAALKSNDELSRETLDREAARLAETLDRLDREIASEIETYGRLRDQVKERAIDPGIREEIVGLDDSLRTRTEQYKLDIAALQQQLESAQARNAELLQSAATAGSAELAAWIEQCARIDENYRQILAQSSSDHDKAVALYRERLDAYKKLRVEFEAKREAVEAEYERRCAEHRKNDAAFYNLELQLKNERARADREIARLSQEFEREPRPAEPIKAVPPPPVKPPQPASSSSIAGVIATGELESRISALRAERDAFVSAQQQQIAALRQRSAERSSSAQAQLNAQLAELQSRHESAMARITTDRNAARRAAEQASSTRDAANMDPLAIQREIIAIPERQQQLSLEINRLRQQSEQEMLDTYPGRMAQFLSYFMADKSQQQRIDVVLTFFIPALSLIMSFAPAIVLEVVLHGLIIDRARVLPKRKRAIWTRFHLLGRALRRERGILAASRLALEDKERRIDERTRQLDLEVESRANAQLHALTVERDDARLHLAACAITLEKVAGIQNETHQVALKLVEEQREDISKLANTVIEFDGRSGQQREADSGTKSDLER